MTWLAVTYRVRTGHRRPWTWVCSCGTSEHARSEAQAYRRAAAHIDRAQVAAPEWGTPTGVWL